MAKEIKRICVACRKSKNRQDLLKITKQNGSHNIIVNPNSKIFGRSAYLCYNEMCVKEAFKKKKLEKALKITLTEDLKNFIKSIEPMV